MVEEFNSIHVLEQPVYGHHSLTYRQVCLLDITPFFDQLPQQMSFHSIFIRYGIPEFMVQRLAYDVQVAVLTENRGNEEPMVCCSHAAITPMVAHERTSCKFGYIGRGPLIGGGPIEIRFRGMFYICRIHPRSEEHTSELQSLMRISYAVFCL